MTRRHLMPAAGLIAVAMTFAVSSPAPAQPKTGGAEPELLGTYGDWGAYSANSGGRKVCFALAKPQSAQLNRPGRQRDATYMFVSTRPTENVRNEVSIIFGYTFKPNADATVEIGSSKFPMYTQKDGGWIKNAAEEGRMIDAMRKSGELVVKGTSTSGTESTDRYSLKGLGQALDRTAQECK